jgi:PilZ domain.
MGSNGSDRRKAQRLRLQVPMFIRGVDASGEAFLDLTKTLDISAGGAYLAVGRTIRRDEVVSLTIPAPPPTPGDAGLVPAATPPIQARVRRSHMAGGVHLVGVEFLRPLE